MNNVGVQTKQSRCCFAIFILCVVLTTVSSHREATAEFKSKDDFYDENDGIAVPTDLENEILNHLDGDRKHYNTNLRIISGIKGRRYIQIGAPIHKSHKILF